MNTLKKLTATLFMVLFVLPALAAGGKVNINKADQNTLMTELDGVDQALADRIVSQREKEGIYIAPYDLLYVDGIDRDFFKKNYDRITVGKVDLGMKKDNAFDPNA